MTITKPVLIAFAIALAIGITVDILGREAVSRAWIAIDVSDGHGHGPDYGGREWEGAERGHIRKWAVVSSIACFPIALFATRWRKNDKGS